MNQFKSIKNAILGLTILEKIDGKDLPILNIFKEEVKNSKLLQEQFKLDNKLNNIEVSEEIKVLYINESLKYFNDLYSKDISDANENLYKKVSKILNEEQKQKLDQSINENKFIFDELIFESCKDKNNLDVKLSLIENFIKDKNVVQEKIEDVPAINEKILQSAINKFNDKYSFLNENEKDILNAFLYDDKNNIKNIFLSLIKEASNQIKRKLSEEDENNVELYEKISSSSKKALNKLNEMRNQESISIDDILKLSELKNSI